jgi:hypothetical protein
MRRIVSSLRETILLGAGVDPTSGLRLAQAPINVFD